VTTTPTESDVIKMISSLSNWGRWGTDDELGTINLITAAKRNIGFRLVLFCHDIIPLMFPHFYKRADVEAQRRYCDLAFPAADLVIFGSRTVAADVRAYFGDGDEFHMAFHFPLMPRVFLAVRHADRRPVTDIFLHTPEIPPACQWCLFLRNHDELTLEMVSEDERRHLYYAYGQDPRMRLNVGIRRRLAPLLDNDRRKIELLTALLFTLPGSPILYYGDELGMGDNIYLGDRNGVRTPMQWTGDRNAGFSRADTARLFLPLIVDPVYGYQAINIEAQLRTPTSLLKWMKRIIEVRKKTRVFGRGTLRFLRPANESVVAHVRSYEGETVLAVHNLSSAAQPVELDLRPWAGQTPIEMLGESRFPTIGEQPYVITLGPYGYYWFRLQPPLSEQPLYGIEYTPL